MTLSGDCAVWLYGSHARGDADALSDVDVLVVSDRDVDLGAIAPVLGFPSHISVTRYAWSEIEAMAEYGSLFLRHLQLEACAVSEDTSVQGRLGQVLSSLPRYSLGSRDMKGFQTVLHDVRSSLGSDAYLTFELATVATLVRHSCILGCSLFGSPCFSRFEPVKRMVLYCGLVSSWSDEFPLLYAYKMYADGRSERPGKPSHDMARLWCDRAGALLGELEVRINECN